MRVEPDHVARVGYEVRQRVDIVEVRLAVAVVDQEFDPADIQMRTPRDPLGYGDDVARWIGLLDAHARLRRVERARRS